MSGYPEGWPASYFAQEAQVDAANTARHAVSGSHIAHIAGETWQVIVDGGHDCTAFEALRRDPSVVLWNPVTKDRIFAPRMAS